MHVQKLKQLGLTDGESRVYLALIELGSTTVSPIVKKSKVAYSKIYAVLDRLIQKGLVSYIQKDKTRFFQAVEPIRLSEFINKKEEELSNNKKILKELIPLLERISKSQSAHETSIFLGFKGILTAYEIILKNTQKNGIIRFFYVYDPEYSKEIFDFYFKSGVFFRKVEEYYKKKKISWRGIINRQSIQAKNPLPSYPFMKQVEVLFPIPGNMDITEDSLLITAWTKEPIAILIHSKEIAKNFKNYFDSFWEIINKTMVNNN